LLSYDTALIAIAALLVLPLLRPRVAAVADLVVELGEARDRPIRDDLSRARGDPDLQIGYWRPELAAYADVNGMLVQLPLPASRCVTTHIDQNGEPFVLLIHDRVLADDPSLMEAVAAATQLSAVNLDLRRTLIAQIEELTASRRRLIVAADTERERLATRLEHGPKQRIAGARCALDDDTPGEGLLRKALTQLSQTVDDLHEIAAGLHPRELAAGLGPALASLADRCPTQIHLAVTPGRFAAEVEGAVYFGCAEALSNVAKHSAATRVQVTVSTIDGWVELSVADNGRGGADPRRGSGLAGIHDRFAALGGSLNVTSGAAGTILTARLPASFSGPS
jgi:signal transduction histidine kinase